MALFRKKQELVLIPSSMMIGGKEIDTAQRPEDIVTQQNLTSRVVKWCIFNSFLIMDLQGKNPVANITGVDLKSRLPQYIYTMNLRRLCNQEFFNETLVFMADTDFDRPLSRMIDLHIQLATELDPRFLNLYIHKLIYTLDNVYPDEVPEVSWQTIFTSYPYLWVLFPIQKVMREATPIG